MASKKHRRGVQPPGVVLTRVAVAVRQCPRLEGVSSLVNLIEAFAGPSVLWLLHPETPTGFRPELSPTPRRTLSTILELLEDQLYRESVYIKSVTSAAGRGDLKMLGDIHTLLPSYKAPGSAYVEAARNSQLGALQWLVDTFIGLLEPNEVMCQAVRRQDRDMIEWLRSRDVPVSPGAVAAAAACGHFEMVKELMHDLRFGFCKTAVQSAIDHGHLEIATWLMDHPNRVIDPHLISLERARRRAMEEGWGDELSDDEEWTEAGSFADLSDRQVFMLGIHAEDAVANGHLDASAWKVAQGGGATASDAFDRAAANGHLNVVEWMCSKGHAFDSRFFERLAMRGQFDTILWICTEQTECMAERLPVCVMDAAAGAGRLDLIAWIHRNRAGGCTFKAMDASAASGHMDVLMFLQNNRTEGCSKNAMDGAAGNGYLKILQWLSTNRSEGCTELAMANAAGGGHLEVVEWLSVHASGQNMTAAFHAATSSGQLDVVSWLLSQQAGRMPIHELIADAVRGNHFELVKWLYDNDANGLGISDHSIQAVTQTGNMEMLQWLLDRRSKLYDDVNGKVGKPKNAARRQQKLQMSMDDAAASGNFAMMVYIRSKFQPQCSITASTAAARHFELKMLQWLHRHYESKFNRRGVGQILSDNAPKELRDWVSNVPPTAIERRAQRARQRRRDARVYDFISLFYGDCLMDYDSW